MARANYYSPRLKQRGWPESSARFVRVHFADEPDIPFPDNRTLKDFVP